MITAVLVLSAAFKNFSIGIIKQLPAVLLFRLFGRGFYQMFENGAQPFFGGWGGFITVGKR